MAKQDPEIELFLSSLDERPDCIEKRAYAGKFIKKNRKGIEDFIERKRGHNRDKLADYYQGLVKRYEEGPKGYGYDLQSAQLRSFRMSKRAEDSFSLKTPHRTAKVVGYGIALLLAGCVLYLGYVIKKSGSEVLGRAMYNIEKQIDEVNK